MLLARFAQSANDVIDVGLLQFCETQGHDLLLGRHQIAGQNLAAFITIRIHCHEVLFIQIVKADCADEFVASIHHQLHLHVRFAHHRFHIDCRGRALDGQGAVVLEIREYRQGWRRQAQFMKFVRLYQMSDLVNCK